MSEVAIAWFEEVGLKDVPRVGGKNASLGEMARSLAKGVREPLSRFVLWDWFDGGAVGFFNGLVLNREHRRLGWFSRRPPCDSQAPDRLHP